MRALTILAVIQTAAILFLLYTVIANGSGGADIPMHRPDALTNSAYDTPRSPPALDEVQVRRIIQEEFELYLGQGVPSAVVGTEGRSRTARDPVADRRQLEDVERKFAYYINAGEIDPMDLNALHGEIAKLHPDDRQAMLNRLTRAMNSGRIKGHL